MFKRLRAIVLSTVLLFSTIAGAETTATSSTAALPTTLSSVVQTLENIALSGGNLAGAITLGTCLPTFAPASVTSMEFQFTSSATCPISGNVTLGILPITADINLEFTNIPFIQSVSADFTATVGVGAGGLTTQWELVNGAISYQLVPGGPVSSWDLTGAGTRTRALGQGLTINSRFNVFDPATGAGYTLERQLTRRLLQVTSNTSQTCTVTGATATDPTSGTLTNCQPIAPQASTSTEN